MEVATHAGMTGRVPTPFEIGAKHIRSGLWLFIFGLLIGFVPIAHYMHGSFEPVGEVFLKNVTQAVCIAIYGVGVMCAYGSIKRASHVLMGARVQPVASGDSPCLKKVS